MQCLSHLGRWLFIELRIGRVKPYFFRAFCLCSSTNAHLNINYLQLHLPNRREFRCESYLQLYAYVSYADL